MKKSTFIVASLAAVAAIACTEENPVAVTPVDEAVTTRKVELKAAAPADGTKVAFTENEDAEAVFAWEADDEIAVWCQKDREEGEEVERINQDGMYVSFKVKSIDDSGVATFEGEVADGYTPGYTALYPARIAMNPGGSSYNTVARNSVSLPWEYTYEQVQNGRAAPMYAALNDAVGEDDVLDFKHLCGMLKIVYKDVPAGVNKLKLTTVGYGTVYKLTSAASEKRFPIDNGMLVSATLSGITSASEELAKNRATIHVVFDALTESQDLTVYLPVPVANDEDKSSSVNKAPGAYKNLAVVLENADGELPNSVQVATKAHAIDRGTLLIFPPFKVDTTVEEVLAGWSNHPTEDNLEIWTVKPSKNALVVGPIKADAGNTESTMTWNILSTNYTSKYAANTVSVDGSYVIKSMKAGEYLEYAVPAANLKAGDKIIIRGGLYTSQYFRFWNIQYLDGETWKYTGQTEFVNPDDATISVTATIDLGSTDSRQVLFKETFVLENGATDLKIRLQCADNTYNTKWKTYSALSGTFRLDAFSDSYPGFYLTKVIE